MNMLHEILKNIFRDYQDQMAILKKRLVVLKDDERMLESRIRKKFNVINSDLFSGVRRELLKLMDCQGDILHVVEMINRFELDHLARLQGYRIKMVDFEMMKGLKDLELLAMKIETGIVGGNDFRRLEVKHTTSIIFCEGLKMVLQRYGVQEKENTKNKGALALSNAKKEKVMKRGTYLTFLSIHERVAQMIVLVFTVDRLKKLLVLHNNRGLHGTQNITIRLDKYLGKKFSSSRLNGQDKVQIDFEAIIAMLNRLERFLLEHTILMIKGINNSNLTDSPEGPLLNYNTEQSKATVLGNLSKTHKLRSDVN
jgi:ribosomal protein L7Ae-like RNA K-turn-binding protein